MGQVFMQVMKNILQKPSRFLLSIECVLLFMGLPSVIFFHPTRPFVLGGLWMVTAYSALLLHFMPGFSWKETWQGRSWKKREFRIVFIRFLVSTLGIYCLIMMREPWRLFSFPKDSPLFWLVIMMLYPFLSALPQEVIFRSFFFRRYAPLFPHKWSMITASAFVFGFIHIVFHNPISPLLSFICGVFLAHSYSLQGSLKRVAIEHALYGDMVFTLGLGMYFVTGHHFGS